MRNLLFISHRFPYPPDRGEKIRIWHVLRHLARSHRVFLACLVDDARDWQHEPVVAGLCAELGCFAIDKARQKRRALMRFRPGRPLMLDYYDRPELRHWIAGLVQRETIDVVYAFSTAMAPYAEAVAAPVRILDMVDVDSEKWAEYATTTRWPTRLVWAREARTLLAYERRAAQTFDRTLLVTAAERRRFSALAPESEGRTGVLENGVDFEFFAPSTDYPDPYPPAVSVAETGPWITMVGNMDYWPNEDAAAWCATEILPLLRRQLPQARLAVVGSNPGPGVVRLTELPGVLVTGRVADVRPWLAHAAAVVAPLRIARGVQNKVLEGMAMGRPVVASPQAFLGIRAEPGRDLLVADGAAAMADALAAVLGGQHDGLGPAGRAAVERHHAWPAQLAPLDAILGELEPASA